MWTGSSGRSRRGQRSEWLKGAWARKNPFCLLTEQLHWINIWNFSFVSSSAISGFSFLCAHSFPLKNSFIYFAIWLAKFETVRINRHGSIQSAQMFHIYFSSLLFLFSQTHSFVLSLLLSRKKRYAFRLSTVNTFGEMWKRRIAL